MNKGRPPVDRNTPAVPVEFARLILQMLAERGLSQERALEGLGDAVMAQLMTERLERERLARRHQGSTDIRVLVRELLVPDADGYPALEAAASHLFMSTRTLKRKLQQAETTFQAELDSVRLDDAHRLLGMSALGIEEIAGRMGFAEPASFTHAFRRWTGMTPSEWRSRQKGEGQAPA